MSSLRFKGVSPVIATILMVMITVGLVAFSYSWFIGMAGQAQQSTGEILDDMTAKNAYATFDILSCSGSTITGVLRAQGGAINMSSTEFYYTESEGSSSVLSVSGCTGALVSGGTCTFTVSKACTCSGDSIKVVLSNGREQVQTISGCS